MSKLKIVPVKSRVDYDCVRFLTKMQRAALRGEFQAVALVTESSGTCGTGWAGTLSPVVMIGAVTHLAARLEREELE